MQLYKIRNSISSLELFINSAVILKYTIGNHIRGFIHNAFINIIKSMRVLMMKVIIHS